jgi:hypothetical protein
MIEIDWSIELDWRKFWSEIDGPRGTDTGGPNEEVKKMRDDEYRD